MEDFHYAGGLRALMLARSSAMLALGRSSP